MKHITQKTKFQGAQIVIFEIPNKAPEYYKALTDAKNIQA